MIGYALVAASCHKEPPPEAPVDDGCFGARCVEQAEAALWYGDDAGAREPLERTCEDGDPFGCYRLGELLREGRGGPADPDKAVELYEKACDGDLGEGCERRAVIAAEREEPPKVILDYAQKACDKARPLGCSRAGELYRVGNGVTQDLIRATDLYEKGCFLGDEIGCARTGDLLYDPKGKRETQARALSAYKMGCKGHDGYSCLKAAILFHEGIGTERNLERALYHFVSACELNVEDGCHVQKQLEAAKDQFVDLELKSSAETLEAGGLKAYEITCRMNQQGEKALNDVLASVARRRRALNACAKDGAAVKVIWKADEGRIQDARVRGKAPPKAAKCVNQVLVKSAMSLTGKCEAVLLLGDPAGAAKSLAARVGAPPEAGDPSEASESAPTPEPATTGGRTPVQRKPLR
ncbi:MAG: tetratricopeptide repeat protein [Nannocystaceae bacterium]